MTPARIKANLVANIYSQLVGVGAQFVLVGLFLAFWDKEEYGRWLVIMTIPGYLALGEMGLGTAVANDVGLAMARKEPSKANIALNTAAAFYSILLLTTLCIGSVFCLILPNIASAIVGPAFSSANWAIVELTVYVYANLQLGLLMAIYRGVEKNARGILIGSHSKLFDFGIMAAVLALGYGPAKLLTALVIGRLIFLFLVILDIRLITRELHLWGTMWSISELKRLMPKGFGFLAFSGGLALTLQGMTLAVNGILGPAAVVIFSTTRSLVRFVSQIMGLINNSIWPEFSTLYARGDLATARTLHRIAVATSFYLAIGGSGVVILVGSSILALWTHSQVIVSRSMIALFALPVMCNAIWYTSSTVLWSTNQHKSLAFRFALAAGLSLLLAYPLLMSIGVGGAALALLLLDAVLIPFVLKRSCTILRDDLGDFLTDVATGRSARLYVLQRAATKCFNSVN